MNFDFITRFKFWPLLFKISTREDSFNERRNFLKENGYKSRKSTFPTGKEVPSYSAIPKRLPAQIIAYSGAFS